MKIKIKSLIEFQLYYLFLFGALISVFKLPSFIKYILDLNILIIFFMALFQGHKIQSTLRDRNTKIITNYIFVYLFFLLFISLLQWVPLGQVLWAFRNNFFFIFFFVFCVAYLKKEDVDRILGNIIKFQLLNVIFGVYEFFVLGVKNDYLGGMFGIEQGCNGLLNVYLVFISVLIISKYMNQKSSLLTVLLVVGSALFMAAISELKVFYVELAIIVLVQVLLGRKKLKGFMILAIIGIGLVAGLQILSIVNPASMGYIESIENFFEYGSRSNYGNGDIRIARFTFLSQINEYFFKNNIFLNLFGFGFGACEDSQAFGWANSIFAEENRSLQYRNLTSSMNYLETGLIGLIAFLFIFVLIFILAWKNKDKLLKDKWIVIFVQSMAVLVIIICFYDNTIRREIAYLSFFALSTIFIYLKESSKRSSITA